MKFRSSLTAVSVVAVAAVAIAGCGSSKNNSTSADVSSAINSANAPTGQTGATGTGGGAGGSAKVIAISADPTGNLKFVPAAITTKAGKNKLVFTNKSPLTHDVIIGKGFSEGAQVGEVKKISSGTISKTINLKPGNYTFYCDVKGHREAGMVGKLTVTQ